MLLQTRNHFSYACSFHAVILLFGDSRSEDLNENELSHFQHSADAALKVVVLLKSWLYFGITVTNSLLI